MIWFNINYKSSVKQDWKRIPKPAVSQILHAIDGLRTDPRPPESTRLKPPFQDMYRRRVLGSYRVVYSIDEHTRTVTIHMIGTRQNFYDELRRRLRR